jgi:hypothetical protein
MTQETLSQIQAAATAIETALAGYNAERDAHAKERLAQTALHPLCREHLPLFKFAARTFAEQIEAEADAAFAPFIPAEHKRRQLIVENVEQSRQVRGWLATFQAVYDPSQAASALNAFAHVFNMILAHPVLSVPTTT